MCSDQRGHHMEGRTGTTSDKEHVASLHGLTYCPGWLILEAGQKKTQCNRKCFFFIARINFSSLNLSLEN